MSLPVQVKQYISMFGKYDNAVCSGMSHGSYTVSAFPKVYLILLY